MNSCKNLVFSLVVAFVSACSGTDSPYIGDWQHPSKPKDSMSIVRNGESFLVKTGHGDIFPAVVKDGLLEVTVEGGFVLKLSHVKDTDELVMGQDVFTRKK